MRMLGGRLAEWRLLDRKFYSSRLKEAFNGLNITLPIAIFVDRV
jgi:hypothetical protein